MIDKYNVNPAFGGLDRSLSVNLNYRTQWQGINKNPRQFYINGHMPLYIFNGAAGFKLYSDVTGALSTTGFNISYNYVYPIPGGVISSGLSLGLKQNKIDGRSLTTPDGIYDLGIFSHQDPILHEATVNSLSPDWSIGIFIGHNYFDVGITISNLTATESSFNLLTLDNSKNISFYAQVPLLIGNFELYPSVLMKSNLELFQTDLSCLVKNGNIFGGMSLRGYNEKSLESIIIIGGLKINNHYTLSYSYDVGISDLNLASQGSHEIQINYNLNKKIGIGLPPEIIYNPRNL